MLSHIVTVTDNLISKCNRWAKVEKNGSSLYKLRKLNPKCLLFFPTAVKRQLIEVLPVSQQTEVKMVRLVLFNMHMEGL